MNTLAERLKYAREKLRLTQQEVANLAGMSQPTYYKIESGKTQRTTYLNELANILGVNPNCFTMMLSHSMNHATIAHRLKHN